MGAPELADPALALLGRLTGAGGVRAYAVGGYVRDRLLGREHPDLDVVVEGDALDLARRFAQAAGAPPPVVFERFGTAQVTWEGRQVEFAAARAESYAADSRKPDVRPAPLDEDLRRRDFTVNTLLMDFEGRVIDRLGGLADLRAEVLRTPREPGVTFSDDPLRMLRAVRFSAQLGFRLDPGLPPAMRRMAARLAPPVVSVERSSGELRKMLVSPRPGLALRLLGETGLLSVLLPEVAAMRGVAQGGFHDRDVYEHCLATMELVRPDLVLRTAALLHDVGKPATALEGAFPGHEVAGAATAAELLRRLRFANHEIDAVTRLIRLHLRPVYYQPHWTDGAVRRLDRDAGDAIEPLLELARADIRASAYPEPDKVDELADRVRRLRAEAPDRYRIPVSGEDLMRLLELAPGPAIGRAKARLEEMVLDGRLPPERGPLLEYVREHPELAS